MSLESRFWAKVKKAGPDECWLWTAATKDGGYGVMRPEGQRTGPTVKAHRVSAQLAGMDIAGRMVLHSCDNPPCVNPAHLHVGDHVENMRERLERERTNRGEINGMAKLSADDVLAIRQLVGDGALHREAAAAFGVSRSRVTTIVGRKSWQHVAVTPPAARDLIAAVVESLGGAA